MNDRLNLISGDEPLMLDPTDGQETLAQATDVFRYIDRNFEDWKCNRVGRATKETQVQVYEMVGMLRSRKCSAASLRQSVVSLSPKPRSSNS